VSERGQRSAEAGYHRADDGGERERRRSAPGPTGYYGVPPVHKAHWKWLIIAYFFLGGISGGSYVIAAMARQVVPPNERTIVRAGRYLSLATLIPCPLLLILDLGRPSRFLHMLRVLKLRSPMSIGTWGIIAFSGCSSASALIQADADGLLPRGLSRIAAILPNRFVDAVGASLGLLVGSYTGVLLAATAVPLWTKRACWLGPLFLTSALSTAAAGIDILISVFDHRHHAETARLRRMELVLLPVELALLSGWRTRLGSTARPLREGSTGSALRGASAGAGLVLPFLLQLATPSLPCRVQRWMTLAASFLVLMGGFALRYAVVVGGQRSADDPDATFDMTRANAPINSGRSPSPSHVSGIAADTPTAALPIATPTSP